MNKEIIESLNQRGEMRLKDFYALIPDKTPASIRGNINSLVKQNLIIRKTRGVYSKI